MDLIVGRRAIFPEHLCAKGRKKIIEVLEKENIEVISLSEKDTKSCSVETMKDVRKCVALFDKHRNELSGLIVTLPNLGDERALADASATLYSRPAYREEKG